MVSNTPRFPFANPNSICQHSRYGQLKCKVKVKFVSTTLTDSAEISKILLSTQLSCIDPKLRLVYVYSMVTLCMICHMVYGLTDKLVLLNGYQFPVPRPGFYNFSCSTIIKPGATIRIYSYLPVDLDGFVSQLRMLSQAAKSHCIILTFCTWSQAGCVLHS